MRFYFGIRPNKEGKDQLSLIIVPLDGSMQESERCKIMSDAQQVGDDVGHGTDSEQFNSDTDGVQSKMVLFKIVTKKAKVDETTLQ